MGAVEDNSLVSESEKLERIKLLKLFIQDCSDEGFYEVLTRTKWDTDKALELMMEETYNQRNMANQRRVCETQSAFASQARSSSDGQANAFLDSYQVSKPSKRRR